MRNVTVDTEALGAVLIRTVDPEPTHDQKTGERIWRGTVMVPTTRGAEEIAFKTAATPPAPGSRVTLTGDASLTAWYQSRGRSGSTGVTLRASGWAEHTGTIAPDHFTTRGIPVTLPPVTILGWGQANDRGERNIECVLPADAKWDADGGCVTVSIPGDPDLNVFDLGRLIGAEAVVNLVDREDVGRYGKAQLRFRAARIERVTTPAPNRKTPAPQPAESVS